MLQIRIKLSHAFPIYDCFNNQCAINYVITWMNFKRSECRLAVRTIKCITNGLSHLEKVYCKSVSFIAKVVGFLSCNDNFSIPTTLAIKLLHFFFGMFNQMKAERLHFETDKFIFDLFGVVLIRPFRLMNAFSLFASFWS